MKKNKYIEIKINEGRHFSLKQSVVLTSNDNLVYLSIPIEHNVRILKNIRANIESGEKLGCDMYDSLYFVFGAVIETMGGKIDSVKLETGEAFLVFKKGDTKHKIKISEEEAIILAFINATPIFVSKERIRKR